MSAGTRGAGTNWFVPGTLPSPLPWSCTLHHAEYVSNLDFQIHMGDPGGYNRG